MTEDNERKEKILDIIIPTVKLLAVALLAGAIVWVMVKYIEGFEFYNEHFTSGTFINGVDCEDMTPGEAAKALLEDKDYNLVIRFPHSRQTIKAEDINYQFSLDTSMTSLLNQQPHYSYFLYTPKEYTVGFESKYNKDLLEDVMRGYAELDENEMTPPEDAYIDYADGKYFIVPEVEGNMLDVGKAKNIIRQAVENGSGEAVVGEDLYVKPKVREKDETLQKELKELNKYAIPTITIEYPNGTIVLDTKLTRDWLTKTDDGYKKDAGVWRNKIAEIVQNIANETNTFGNERTFDATGIGDVTVKGVAYGFEVDQEKTIDNILAAMEGSEPATVNPVYSSWDVSPENNGFGHDYVEIDLTRQHLWVYKGGNVAYETDVVSGAMTEDRYTPSGVYMFVTKESPSVLVGERDANGIAEYRTTVTYWMPFIRNEIGIHDATWQPAFGGNRYQEGFGSHGCINVSMEAAQTIYNLIDFNMPVIVYYSGGCRFEQ